MGKVEAKKEFLEDLRSKIPNQEIFAVATKSQIEMIANQILPEIEQKVNDFFEKEEKFDFTMAEIPSDLWFEIITFLVLSAEEVKNPILEKRSGITVMHLGTGVLAWDDDDFFDLEDEALCNKIEEIRHNLVDSKKRLFYQIAMDVTIEDLMAYAKEHPDF